MEEKEDKQNDSLEKRISDLEFTVMGLLAKSKINQILNIALSIGFVAIVAFVFIK